MASHSDGQGWRFLVCKAALGQVFYEYFGFPNNHSTDCSTLTVLHHSGQIQYAKYWQTYQVDSLASSKETKTTVFFISHVRERSQKRILYEYCTLAADMG
jgi:hypothetical protein